MTKLTPGQLLADAQSAGFKGVNAAIIAAIAEAESGGNTAATGYNPGSQDRGVLQINDVFHPNVSNQCAYDPTGLCAFQAAYQISGGSNFSQWTTYTTGAYAKYVSEFESGGLGLSGSAGSLLGSSQPISTGLSSTSGSNNNYGLPFDWRTAVVQGGLVLAGITIVLIGIAVFVRKPTEELIGGAVDTATSAVGTYRTASGVVNKLSQPNTQQKANMRQANHQLKASQAQHAKMVKSANAPTKVP